MAGPGRPRRRPARAAQGVAGRRRGVVQGARAIVPRHRDRGVVHAPPIRRVPADPAGDPAALHGVVAAAGIAVRPP